MADGALLFYVALLHETKRRREERLTKVRTLAPPASDETDVAGPVSMGGERS